MNATLKGQKTELAEIISSMGFDTNNVKFKKISKKHGIYFNKKCQYEYTWEDENGKNIENICKQAKLSLVYIIRSEKKGLRTPYVNVCVKTAVSREDVEENDPCCETCASYIKNVAKDLERKIIIRYFKK